jgi:hypothetical protein
MEIIKLKAMMHLWGLMKKIIWRAHQKRSQRLVVRKLLKNKKNLKEELKDLH